MAEVITLAAEADMGVAITLVDTEAVAEDTEAEVEDAVDQEAMEADTEEVTLSLVPTEEVVEEEIHTDRISLTKGRNVLFSLSFSFIKLSLGLTLFNSGARSSCFFHATEIRAFLRGMRSFLFLSL